MHMKKDTSDEDILDSLRGIKRAEPNAFLFTRIEARLNNVRTERVFTFRLKLAAGVCALVLITNSIILFKDARSALTESQTANSVYQMSKSSYQIY